MARRRAVPQSSEAPATEPGPPPAGTNRRLTRVFWAVLSGLFFAGMGFTILGMWALTNAWDGETLLLWLPVAGVGIAGGLFCLLLTIGVVYRADRMRGNLVRRIAWFE